MRENGRGSRGFMGLPDMKIKSKTTERNARAVD
jgi:hypothetical protein